MQPWRVEHSCGDAGAFHTADPDGTRSATFHSVPRPTLVLGSAQPEATVDLEAAVRLGVHIVRRRSGGGGVLLIPGEFVWLDLVLPAGDPLWSDDVGASMVWVGELWQRALRAVGDADGSLVHRGPLVRNEWSQAVCWAGVGSGEVLSAGAKLVGISQRRTRSWARFQSMCHLVWRPEMVASLVTDARLLASDLAGLAATVSAGDAVVQAALVGALP
ncbi:MAG: hypothetical protein Q7V57_15380 [Actinomycetota bacterium]|nr:hypothetical protein [Actinomycetota bacterium]